MNTCNLQIKVFPFDTSIMSPWGRRFRTIDTCIQLADMIQCIKYINENIKCWDLKSWHPDPRWQALRIAKSYQQQFMNVGHEASSPKNCNIYYMINLIQSHPSHVPTAGDYSHVYGGALWRGGDALTMTIMSIPSSLETKGILQISPPGEFQGVGGFVSKMGKRYGY